MSENIITVSNVSKIFRKTSSDSFGKIGWTYFSEKLFRRKVNVFSDNFCALSNINFIVKEGQSLGIVGLNGSGKSTLLQLIAGTMEPTSGKIETKGKIAALLELGSGFNPSFTGRENVEINSALHGISRKEYYEIIPKIEKFADIGNFFEQPVSTYSTGMQIRLAFSVLVYVKPKILIIDEALAVGDAKFQLKCNSYIEKFQKEGGTLILVSHDLNNIAKHCEKSILIDKGIILSNNYTNRVINEYSYHCSRYNNKNKNDLSNIKESYVIRKEFGLNTVLSYGSDKGYIKNYKINNKITDLILTGSKFNVSFDIISLTKIKNPIFSFRIRDTKGQDIYCTNTKYQKKHIPVLREKEELSILFEQNANIMPGIYFISLGFTCMNNNKHEVIQRLRECIQFEVYSGEESFGISNCFSKISIKKI